MSETAGIGHNRPPVLTEEQIELAKALAAAGNRWINERPEIETEEIAEKAHDFITQCRAFLTEADGAERVKKRPLEEELEGIRAAFRRLRRPVQIALDAVAAKRQRYMNAKAERIRREQREAARKAREKEEAARRAAQDAERAREEKGDVIGARVKEEEEARAAAQAAKLKQQAAKKKPRVRGSFGQRAAHFRTVWKVEITDIDAAFRQFRHKHELREVILKLAREEIRLKKDPNAVPGIKATAEKKAV